MLLSYKANSMGSNSACQTLLFISNKQLWLLGKLLFGMCTSYSLWSQFFKAKSCSCCQIRKTEQLHCRAAGRLMHGAGTAVFQVWSSFAICTVANKFIACLPAQAWCACAGWDLHVPLQREGLPLPCIARAFCFCDIWATAAVIRRGLLFLEIISQVSVLFIKICSVCCKLVTLI